MFAVAVLWAAFFVVNFNIATMIPLLPFVQADIGISVQDAGAVLAVFPIVALFGNLALGPWIDRFGRKRFLIVGSIACTAIFLLTASARSGQALIGYRALTGLFMPMLGASVFAAVADYVPPAGQGRAYGYVATAAPAAFLLAISMGVLLAGYATWQIPILLIAVVTAAVGAGASRLPPTPRPALSEGAIGLDTYKRRILSLSLGTSTRLLLLGHFLWNTATFMVLGLYPAWAIQHGLPGRDPGAIGGMLFVGEAGGLLGALYSSRLSKHYAQPLKICAAAAIATGAAVLTMPFGGDSLLFQAGAYTAFAFGRDMMLAPIQNAAMSLVPATQRGSLNAMLNVVYQGGATAGALIGASLYAVWPDFTANALASTAAFGMTAASLWWTRTDGANTPTTGRR
jgi:predicted MFS family arabinose efflux permease